MVTVDEKSGYIKAHYEINKDYCKNINYAVLVK